MKTDNGSNAPPGSRHCRRHLSGSLLNDQSDKQCPTGKPKQISDDMDFLSFSHFPEYRRVSPSKAKAVGTSVREWDRTLAPTAGWRSVHYRDGP